MNRFKGLYLTYRVPEELWIKACNILQEAVIKTIPKKRKCQNANWFSEEALYIVEKRKEMKAKGERERKIYSTECRIPEIKYGNKKAFLNEQCKEIEKSMGYER